MKKNLIIGISLYGTPSDEGFAKFEKSDINGARES